MSLLLFCKLEAQTDTNNNNKQFQLEVNIPTQKGKKIYLGQYWKSGTYAIDSTFISEKGKANFSSSEKKSEGQYFLYIKPDYQVDFLIGDEQNNIKLELNENDIYANKVSGSKDTQLLWTYLQITYETEKIREKVQKEGISKKEKQSKEKQLENIEKRFNAYKETVSKESGNKWGAIYLKGLESITLPYPEPKNQEEYNKNKVYGKQHYFDNINLTDPRFWRTNYMESHVDIYMQQWVDPVPDSLAAAASRLVEKTKGNEICFEQMLSKLTNESIKSTQLGHENIWARLYEDYIKDNNISWIDSTQYIELAKMYEKIKLNRVGMKAQNLLFKTFDGDSINTNNIDSKYTILYFYSPDCSYCLTETPKLHDELYAKYKDKGLKIVAINIGSNKNEWANFINNNKLTGWINCADFNFKSKYWMYYDVSGTPAVYVLNENKEIVAKKLNLENLKKLFNYLIQ